MMARGTRTVLLTGGSGFLGKVALYDMVRRREELNLAGIVVVIRARGARSAQDRFRNEVATSPCFADLPRDWTRLVRVLDGDLASPDFGTSASDRALLAGVTHVIHSAAAVSFNLPGAVAARANVTTSLNLLAALRASPRLERVVYVSTAYVTPHHDGPITEQLVPLPAPADELLAALSSGTMPDAEILARTGHPNTYTLTKTIAEHTIAARCPVPLSIVRPSIITASRESPMPGWIDSTAGFGAFVTLIGLGHLRAVVGRADARLDLVAVDDVSRCVLDEVAATTPGLTIRHSVAGVRRAPLVGECWDAIGQYFQVNPVQRRPAPRYLGPRNSAFAAADLVHHRLPIVFANLGSPARRRQARKLASRLDYLNEVFPYFTTRTFDFESSVRAPENDVDTRTYLATICRGVSTHLLAQRKDEWTLAGRTHVKPPSDVRWVLGQPSGNAAVRLGIWLSMKTLRRITDSVTVDVPSFERARASVPDGAAIALVPSHRSFLDFILCSYLAFARPDLGIKVPYVAAAIEFGRLPLLGSLLRAVQAFYVERGAVKQNRHLDKRVHAMLDAGETVEFFVEGARSRSRSFLTPKYGLLRCVQSSGRPCVLLPIAISYDRIPEEAVFARELAGATKAPLRAGPLLGWLADVWRGRVQLGRVHIACGTPVSIDETTDVKRVGREVISALRDSMAVTSFHVDAYATRGGDGVDPAALRARIVAAGGRVLASPLPVPADLDPLIARTYLEQFSRFLISTEAAPTSAVTSTTADRAEPVPEPVPPTTWERPESHDPAHSTLSP